MTGTADTVTVVVLASLACVGLTAGGALAQSSDQTVSVAGTTVDNGETTTVAIELSAAPSGLVGFELDLRLEDGAIGAITDAGYPDAYELTDPPDISEDNTSVALEAANLDGAPRENTTDITLATVTLRGTDDGTTDLSVSINALDDGDGSAIGPTTESGTLTVEATEGGGGGGGSTGGDSDDTSTTETDEGGDYEDDTPNADTDEGDDSPTPIRTTTGEVEAATGTNGQMPAGATPTESASRYPSEETTGGSGPGFGVAITVTGALVAVVLLGRHERF